MATYRDKVDILREWLDLDKADRDGLTLRAIAREINASPAWVVRIRYGRILEPSALKIDDLWALYRRTRNRLCRRRREAA